MSRKALLLSLYGPCFLFSFMEGMLLLVLPLYLLDLGMSLSVIGLILAGRPAGMLIADVPVGMLIGRYGQKVTMLIGLAVFGSASLGMFFTTQTLAVFLLQIVTGMSTAAFGVARLTTFVELFEPDQRGRSIALMGGFNRFGYFAGPVIGGVLAKSAGLSSTFVLSGLLSFVAYILVWVCMRESRTDESLPIRNLSSHLNLMRSLLFSHWQTLLPAGLGQTLAQLIRASRQVLIPLFGAEAIGLGVDQIGFIVGIAAAIDTSLFYFAGWMMDNWGRKAAIIPSFAIQTAGIALLPLVGTYTSFLLVACLIGVGNGLGSGNMMTLGGDLAPPQSRGEFLGIWRLIGDAGHTGAPLLIGSVAQIVTMGAAAFSVSVLGLISVLLFLWAVPETHQGKRKRIKSR